ncbi:MAG TPA: AAA family ATPase [Candidatus Saccharimonadia bacterium]
MNFLVFITGVSGAGKSTLLPLLKGGLPRGQFDVHDIDENGVPDGADSHWRRSRVAELVEIANDNAKRSVRTVVCGTAEPRDLPAGAQADFILLDVSDNEIRRRLKVRNNGDMSHMADRHIEFAKYLRTAITGPYVHVFDTSDATPEVTAVGISALLRSNF